VLVGGGTTREELISLDPPRSFGCTLCDITGPLSSLVSRVEGAWAFEPAGTGTKVTWRWTIHSRSDLTARALPVFGRLWRGYARQALEELSNLLVP
jgi:Polyketide cyclase / dehydrase and lipid transport